MRRPTRNQRGASALELSILAPAFLLLVFTIIEFGLWMHGRNVALAAAREGVASLRTAQSFESHGQVAANAETTAKNTVYDLGMLQDPQATAVYDEGAQRVTVTVSGTVVDLIPGLDLKAEGRATGYIEDFRPDYGLDEVKGGN